MPQDSRLLDNFVDERNILLGNGLAYFGEPLVKLGQIKGDASFNYTLRPYDVRGGNPLIILRRFTLEESASVMIPILEVRPEAISLWFRNFASGASLVTGTASGGGTFFSQQFGGSSKVPFSVMRFEHPTPEQGYIAVQGFSVYPPVELRLPFPESRETIFDGTFEFRHKFGNLPGQQLGQFDVFVMPLPS